MTEFVSWVSWGLRSRKCNNREILVFFPTKGILTARISLAVLWQFAGSSLLLRGHLSLVLFSMIQTEISKRGNLFSKMKSTVHNRSFSETEQSRDPRGLSHKRKYYDRSFIEISMGQSRDPRALSHKKEFLDSHFLRSIVNIHWIIIGTTGILLFFDDSGKGIQNNKTIVTWHTCIWNDHESELCALGASVH